MNIKLVDIQVLELNQSQNSIATLSAVRLSEDHDNQKTKVATQHQGVYKNKNQGRRNAESLDKIREGPASLDSNKEDIESNIDYIDLETEDEYASSVYTRRSVSPTSR